jgi:hypothetical protein
LPKSISECGDVLLGGFVSASRGTVRGPGFLMRLLREQVSLIGVLECLSGAFMSGQVVFFSVVLGAGPMCVGSQVAVLSGYLL